MKYTLSLFGRIYWLLAISFQIFPLFGGVIDLTKPVSESVKPDGIYWAFDGGTIDDWMPDPVIDGSGNAFNGLLQRGAKKPQPTYVEGKFGTAIRFEGNTPFETSEDGKLRTFQNPRVTWMQYDRPSAPDPSLLDMAGTSFTAGAWIKFEEINGGEPQLLTVFHRGRSNGWTLRLLKDPTDQWKLMYYGGGRAESDRVADFNDLEWHHVAFTFKAGAEGNSLQFWLDGKPLGDAIPIRDSITEAPTADRIFTVGESNVGNFGKGFVGAIDDVFVTSGAYEFRGKE